jgi:hypothetical protein
VRNAGCTTHARGDDGEVEDDDDATPRLRNLKARSGGILPEASNFEKREREREKSETEKRDLKKRESVCVCL